MGCTYDSATNGMRIRITVANSPHMGVCCCKTAIPCADIKVVGKVKHMPGYFVDESPSSFDVSLARNTLDILNKSWQTSSEENHQYCESLFKSFCSNFFAALYRIVPVSC